jgi:murein DD-endopeptidase MepM/ murein hydrolase activator NlpD
MINATNASSLLCFVTVIFLATSANASSASDRAASNVDTSSTGCITPDIIPPTTKPANSTQSQTCNAGDFRWPVRGHIIQGFANGVDGINISVPEGTQVKASEEGEVAYAGSELKGYGNMVLIRHPNGYVSAYAHNSELEVKRGDKVKRGQTIAKSGQSGHVESPQLHFELRRGSTPVDPMGCFPTDG